jgi:hypothetical protein
LPADVEPLIEAVYGGAALNVPEGGAWEQALADAAKALREQEKKDSRAARRFLVERPVSENEILHAFSQQLEEDNPEAPAEWRACTRLAKPSVSLVLLYDLDGKVYLDREGTHPVRLDRRPRLADVRGFLNGAVSVQHQGCVSHYAKQVVPGPWEENGMLRFHRVVRLNRDGTSVPGEYPLSYDRQVGVVFTRAALDAD